MCGTIVLQVALPPTMSGDSYRFAAAPLPPPAPYPPPPVTDARVFPNAVTLYSSLPFGMEGQGDGVRLYVADGVGINFLSLPDIGATYRGGDAGMASVAGSGVRKLHCSMCAAVVSPRNKCPRCSVVFIEYLVMRDGSVMVLRTSGPKPFTNAAQSAIEQWVYRPLEYGNRPCQVVSRVEVRFDSEFANSKTSR